MVRCGCRRPFVGSWLSWRSARWGHQRAFITACFAFLLHTYVTQLQSQSRSKQLLSEPGTFHREYVRGRLISQQHRLYRESPIRHSFLQHSWWKTRPSFFLKLHRVQRSRFTNRARLLADEISISTRHGECSRPFECRTHSNRVAVPAQHRVQSAQELPPDLHHLHYR